VLPGALSLWIDAYARDPSHFLVLGALVVLLIGLGVWLGGKIRDRMERIWRITPPATRSKAERVWLGIGAAVALYILLQSRLPSWLRPPQAVQQFLADHVSTSVSAILIATLVALLTPETLVQHLRSWRPYRLSIRGLKLYVLPFLFAFSFLALALLFGSHLIFSIEQSNGMVCKESDNILQAAHVENEGLGACVGGSLASCTGGGALPVCSSRREVFCGEGQPLCERRHKVGCDDKKENCLYYMPVCRVTLPAAPGQPPATRVAGPATCPATCEVGPLGNAKEFDIGKLCHGTGIWLEQGQRYNITLTPPDPDDSDFERTRWKDGDRNVSTRGPTAGATLLQRLAAIATWPLKRNLFEEPFKVIARVGSTGSDEIVMQPDDDPHSDKLDVQIRPKRSGELFLYANESVWALKPLWDWFYRDNTGKATIAVQRPQRN
jgi:hypothetical protein